MSYARIARGPMAADVLQRDFTQIHNRLFRDPRLSFKAKGIFGLISTHRDGYGVTPEWIAAASTDGPSAVKTGLRELEEYGYLHREQVRNPDGTMGPMTYSITDMPSSEPVGDNRSPAATSEDGEKPRSEPVDENPLAVAPLAADDAHKKTTSKNTSGENTTPQPHVGQLAAAVVPPQGVGGQASPTDKATAFVDSLPYRGQVPGQSTRERLVGQVRDAFAAGWTERALHRQLTEDTGNAKTLAGLYLHRLGDLPAASSAAAFPGDVTYTPPVYKAEPAPDAVPPTEALRQARAQLRTHRAEAPHGRGRAPWMPTS